MYSTARFFKSLTVLLVVFVLAAHQLIAADDLGVIKTEVTKRHDEAVKRLQDWIGQVSIAAENRGYPEGAEYMAKLARDAGCVCNARCRRAENNRALFHVRRETIRPGGMDVAAD